jgi:glutamate/tyrosine decarboxylase-like PLP-dependent enzyme
MSLGIHLSRRGRGFPLWFSLATYGTRAYAEAIEQAMTLTQAVVKDIRANAMLELVALPDLSVLVFRRKGWTAAAYATWSRATLHAGLACVVPTRVRGEPALRLCVLNPRVTLEQVRAVLATLS